MKRLLLALALALPLMGQISTRPSVSTSDCINERGEVVCGVVETDRPEHRSYFDGCNWCNCVGEFCSCTLMGCYQPGSEPSPIIYETEPKFETPKPEHHGVIRKLLRWLW